MEPTVFGALVTIAGLVLFLRPLTEMLVLVLACTLFGAASAVNVTALGDSSITPANFALIFLALRLTFSPGANVSNLALAFKRNGLFALFCLYGAITAFILPKLFFHALRVPPLRSRDAGLFAAAPVHFSSQNITTAVYLIGALLVAVVSTIALVSERRFRTITLAIVAVTWAHIFFGIADLFLTAIGHHNWLDIFRNANYARLNQEVEGVRRVAGIDDEPSVYAGFGFALLVFNCELWLRNVRPLLSGVTGFAMLVMLLLTTSSTAYLSLALYGVVLALRVLLTPMNLPLEKLLILGAIATLVVILGLTLMIFFRHTTGLMTDILTQMTVKKMHSVSGIQRAFWARSGMRAFEVSHGLGIGAGSFRCSGLIFAIAGSCGVIGLVCFFSHVLVVLHPIDSWVHDSASRLDLRICGSASWTAVILLVPAILGAASPDPGLLFAFFSGIALSGCVHLRTRNATIRLRSFARGERAIA
jgi:hypothetical protein